MSHENKFTIPLKATNVLIKLLNASETLLQWFKDKRMNVNP